MSRYAARRDQVRGTFLQCQIDSLLVTNQSNVTYLTGFTGDSSYLLLGEQQELLITDFRYITQLEAECPGLRLHVRQSGIQLPVATATAIRESPPKRLGVEADSMSVSFRDHLVKHLGGIELQHTSGIVESFRAIKDEDELAELRRAVWMAQRAFAATRQMLRPDRTERQVANELEYQMREFGAKGCSFPSIVGVAERGALPHGRPSDKRIGEGDFVLIDWGADSGLYKSDLTRLVVTSKISPKLERVYGVVLQAQLLAIEAIRPGAKACDVDAVARDYIAAEGFGEYFGHGLGHGIGLDIHESPRLMKGNTQELQPGMVITVEPGIYLPDWGGVRIEDDVLVTPTGRDVLTSVPKRLEDCVVM